MSENTSDTESQGLGAHFDEMSNHYDALIKKTFPIHNDVFKAMFDYMFLDTQSELTILELGCGTGALTLYAGKECPNAHFTLLDLSPEMLKLCEHKVKDVVAGYELVNKGFMDADFAENKFDLIVSSIALHHLPNEEKPEMYKRIFKWLKPGGVFRCADGHYMLPVAQSHPKIWEEWGNMSRPLGATEADLKGWQEHEKKYDHFVTMREYLAWLDDAGFENVDCYWKLHLWAVWGGQKPQ